MRDSRPEFVVDANVLIDYWNSDITVLTLVSRIIGRIHIPDAVLENVSTLDAGDCDQLGLTIVQPNLDQLLEAGEKRGGLAYDDRLCLILARDHGWLCLTNDKALRTECADSGIEVAWGLEPMLTLVAQGALDVADAESVASYIHESNPAFITKAIIERFHDKLHELATG